MINPKISVIIPIYNAEKYLEQCLNSIINQSLKDIEIICVNDGSTDKSLNIIENFAQNDKRFLIVSQENGGLGKAYNAGIKKACGEYIGFVEPDDFILRKMFETLYDYAQKYNLDFVKSNFIEFTASENFKKQLTFSKEYYNKIINPTEDINVFNFAMNIWTGIYKNDFVKSNNINFNETPGASFQDNGFWFQSFMHASKIMFIDEYFYNYRIDNPNSSINSENKVNCMFEEYDFIMSKLNQYPDKKNKLIKIYQLRRFKNYKFLYKKIAQKYKNNFLMRVKKDYELAYKNNEIDESLFRQDEIEELKRILSNI